MTKQEAVNIMTAFYGSETHSDDDKFLFEEAVRFLIDTYHNPDDMHNLAYYYLEEKRFDLEEKYLMMAAEYGDAASLEELGYIWYYGQNGTVDYEKAFRYFSLAAKSGNPSIEAWAQHKLADMYHYGYFVEKDETRYKKMLTQLYNDMCSETGKYSGYNLDFFPVPDVTYRMAKLKAEEGDIDAAVVYAQEAREWQAEDLVKNTFWGCIEVMDNIVTLQYELNGARSLDLYDVFGLCNTPCKITFRYEDRKFQIACEEDNGIVIGFDHKWYRGPREFLEKARLDGVRLPALHYDLYGFEVEYG